jgi:hypothetical protein
MIFVGGDLLADEFELPEHALALQVQLGHATLQALACHAEAGDVAFGKNRGGAHQNSAT